MTNEQYYKACRIQNEINKLGQLLDLISNHAKIELFDAEYPFKQWIASTPKVQIVRDIFKLIHTDVAERLIDEQKKFDNL